MGALTSLIGVVLYMTPAGDALEQRVGLGWLFNFRGQIAPPPQVAIVGINSQTADALDLPQSPQDWPRSVHARVIDALVARGARVIAFDIFFGHERIREEDDALVSAVARARRVVFVQKLTGKRQPLLDATGQPGGSLWVEELLSPFPALAEAASGLGPFPLPKVDAAVYEFWTFKDSLGDAPTLPAVALRRYVESIAPGPETGGTDDEGAGELTRAERLRESMASEHARHISLAEDDAAVDVQHESAATPRGDGLSRQLAASMTALYDGPPHRSINFYGPPGTIPTYSFQALLRNSPGDSGIPKQAFSGKVVFVGFSDLYDPGQPDRFYSVFTNDEGVDLSGVEIAATAFGNLLQDATLRPTPASSTMLILGAFGLVLSFVMLRFTSSIGVPIAIGIVVSYVASAQWLFEHRHMWLPLANPVLVQAPVAIFAGLLVNYLRERRRSEQYSRTLNYYLPESVARELTENRLDPSAANRVVYSTCLATDMAGFSTLAERLAPGELARVLNDYFDTLAGPLRRQGVDVTEFRADAIMCAWTAAEPELGIRMRAVLAAIECVGEIQSFRTRHDMPTASLRIGLEAGTVYVGHAGGGGHFVFSIVGDCANTASRVEGLNKHLSTQLLATASVVDGLPGLLVRPVGRFQFVGKTDAIPVVEILNRIDAATPEEQELCRRFEGALEAMRGGDRHSAIARLRDILESYPDDGPSRFHLARLERLAAAASADDEVLSDVVRMDAK